MSIDTDDIEILRDYARRNDKLILDMQADQRASDQGAMMFIAAMVYRFGEPGDDGNLVLLSDYDMLMGSEVTLHKANPPSGGVHFFTTIERNTERQLREVWNMNREQMKTPQPFSASLELPPDHIITGEAAVVRGAKMLSTTPGET